MKNMKEEAKIAKCKMQNAKFNHQFLKTRITPTLQAQITSKSNGSAFFCAAIRKKII